MADIDDDFTEIGFILKYGLDPEQQILIFVNESYSLSSPSSEATYVSLFACETHWIYGSEQLVKAIMENYLGSCVGLI